MVRRLDSDPERLAANTCSVDIFGSGDAPDSVARQWLERYQADNAAGTAELVNCILQCAGCDQEITTDDIHDDESIPTRLLDLQNVYQEVGYAPWLRWTDNRY